MVNIQKAIQGTFETKAVTDAVAENYANTFNVDKNDAVGNFLTKKMAMDRVQFEKAKQFVPKKSSGAVLSDITKMIKNKSVSQEEETPKSNAPKLGGLIGLAQSFIKS